jgi:tetratricopeptide (TPR) repeat protein
LGSALFQQKEIQKSAEAYERAILLQPSHIPTLKTLAAVYTYNMDNPRRARELYQRALTLNPDAPDAGDLKALILELTATLPPD